MVLRGTSVVELESFEVIGRFEIGPVNNLVYDLQLRSVVSHTVDTKDPEAPDGPPPLKLRAYEASTNSTVFVMDGIRVGEPVLLVLGCCSQTAQAEIAGSAWHVQAALVEDPDGKLRFLGQEAEFLNDQFDHMRSQSGLTDRDLLVASVDEAVAFKGLDEPGPLLTAARGESVSADDAWYALTIEDRPLDPELTPANELAKLVERTLLLEVEESARTSDTELRVVTSAGVAYRTTLESNRQALIFLPPNGEYELEFVTGDTTLSRAAVEAAKFSVGEATFIRIGFGDEREAARVSDAASTLTSMDDARAVLESWAVDGTPGPEPDEIAPAEAG